MKFLATLVLALTISPSAEAICVRSVDDTDESRLKKATTVFIATITEAKMARDEKGAPELVDRGRNWTYYRVLYTFEVAIEIKGDPSTISFLTTGGLWRDPKEAFFGKLAEQSKFVPGDNILVIASAPGEVPISEIGCTDSMPWNQKAYDLLQSTNLLPPNNSFKPRPLRGSA